MQILGYLFVILAAAAIQPKGDAASLNVPATSENDHMLQIQSAANRFRQELSRNPQLYGQIVNILRDPEFRQKLSAALNSRGANSDDRFFTALAALIASLYPLIGLLG